MSVYSLLMASNPTAPLARLLLSCNGKTSDIEFIKESLAVGYGATSKGRRVATGRVAWLRRTRHDRWEAEQIETERHAGIGRVSSGADLDALVAWMKGGSA